MLSDGPFSTNHDQNQWKWINKKYLFLLTFSALKLNKVSSFVDTIQRRHHSTYH